MANHSGILALRIPWTEEPGGLHNNIDRQLLHESEKNGLKFNIQKTKIMASSPTISWQIDGETMETVTDFTFLGSKITPDGDCSHEIKRHLLLGRKAVKKPSQHIKMQRHYFAYKSPYSQNYGFSSNHVWM